MKLIGAVVALATTAAAALAVQAMIYELDGAPLFSMAHPIGWTIFAERDEELAAKPAGADPMPLLISARPQSGQLWYGTWVVDKVDDFDGAQHYLRSLTEHLFDDVSIADFKTGVHNGMDFRYYDGTAVYLRREAGTIHRENVDFFAAFFKPGTHGVGISLYVGIPSATRKYGDELERSLRSIRPFTPALRSELRSE